MRRCLDYFEQHPITRSVTEAEASGFHHN